MSELNWLGGTHAVHRKSKCYKLCPEPHCWIQIVVVKYILIEHSLAGLMDTRRVLTRDSTSAAGSRCEIVFAKNL